MPDAHQLVHLTAPDPRLPEPLAHTRPPVRELWLSGDATLLARGPRVAVIGSRTPRADAADAAARIAFAAARAGFVIVSGLARGIDSIAHQAALDACAPTIAVLAGGLGRVQPPSSRPLAARIAGAGTGRDVGVPPGHRPHAPGLLVTEHGVGDAEPRPWQFAKRNRIIAALADYVVVIQAHHRSGSMRTCDDALALGVQVGVLPSAPDDPCHSGTYELIQQGADAIVDGGSLFRRLELHGVMHPGFADAAARGAIANPAEPGGWIEPSHPAQLELDDHPLLAHLTVPRTAEELADLTALALADVRLQLLELEDAGRVNHHDDGAWRVARARS